METAAECYRHAVQCDHLAKFALSDADRDVMLAAAVNWRVVGKQSGKKMANWA